MIKIERIWCMPNKWTFTIKPIRELLKRYEVGEGWFDPFAGMNSPAEFTNDLNPEMPTKFHMPALDFVKELDGEYKGVIFDPPYSPRQIKEVYNSIGLKVAKEDTQMNFWSDVKSEAAKRVQSNGLAICCGWNSNGFGMCRGFDMIEVLLVPHGAFHNDTIVTVERKR